MKPEHTQRLDALSVRARAAFACVCIEHVIDLYRYGEFAYTIADAPESLRALTHERDAVDDALALAWKFAAGGSLDEAHWQALSEYLGSYPPNIDEYDELTSAAWACAACRHMLKALKNPIPDSVASVAKACQYTIADGLTFVDDVRLASDRRAAANSFADPEVEWQVRVLERVEQLGAQPLQRQQFADLLAIELSWRRLLPEYRAAKKRP